MTLATLLLAHYCLHPLNYGKTILLAPAIYFLTEALGALGQLFFSWSGKRTFPIHERPFFSFSLGQFWGRDWNRWAQDWLKDVANNIRGRIHIPKLLAIFVISGFFHEVMINFPYWLVYGESFFGTMMLYFIIQSGGLWLEKKYVRGLPRLAQRAWLWMVVLLPSPLFINTPLLTFLGLKNG